MTCPYMWMKQVVSKFITKVCFRLGDYLLERLFDTL